MTGGWKGTGQESITHGDFGEMWLEVAAASIGLLHGKAPIPDLEKADVEVTYNGELNGFLNPSVKIQVKTTTQNFSVDPASGDMTYGLDAKTYGFLRKENHCTPRAVAVVGLNGNGQRSRVTDEGLLLLGHARWVDLKGAPESQNAATVSITLPGCNTFDQFGLMEMIGTIGIPRSTRATPQDYWE